MTTTTANAGKVMQHLEFCHQLLWPGHGCADDLGHRAMGAICPSAGPRARDVLARLVDKPFDISHQAFVFLAAAPVTICGGIPAPAAADLLFRRTGPMSWRCRRAMATAPSAHHGGGGAVRHRAYGTEALGVLRIEKGHARAMN